MSETDSFIQEVSEEVRQDRMFALWKKWGPFVLGAVALIVGGAAYWSWSKSEVRAAAEARGGTFLAADPAVLEQQTALIDKIDGPAKLIAELSVATALADEGNADEAIAIYQGIATREGLSIEYRDLAVLQQARLMAGDRGSDALGLLDPMINGTGPYRLLALELRAAIRVKSGETQAAHEDLNTILADPSATQGLRQRAGAALTATGGQIADPSG